MKEITRRGLIALALPAMASALLNNAYRIIDQYSVKWLGTAAQAAVGSTTFILIASYALFMVISAGFAPLFARAIGAKKQGEQGDLLGQSIIATVISSGVFCSLLLTTNFHITAAVGLTEQAAVEMQTYLYWLGLTGAFLAFGPLIDAAYISAGNTRFPMFLQLLSTILNGFLNWLLIYKLNLGIAGAAIASGVSRGIVSLIGLYYVWKDFSPQFHFDRHFHTLRRVSTIGTPAALGTGMYALVYWALLKVAISPLGPHVNAALGIGFSALEGVAWPLYAGIMIAISSLVGRQLGAEQPVQAIKSIKLAAPLSASIGVFISLVFYFCAEPICAAFTNDPQTLEAAILYAHILAFSQIFVAFEALSEGVLHGAGDTKSVFWISVPLNILRVPLSYWCVSYMGWGAAGIWWIINLTTIIKCILKWHWVWRGKWLDIQP